MSDFKDFPGLKIWKKNSRTFKDFQKSVEQDSCVSLKNLELAGKWKLLLELMPTKVV